MIEPIMYVALGFIAACLLVLLIAPAAWQRAVRLTQRRIEATMPVTPDEISADKDLLRAEYTVQIRRLELALDKAKDRAARHLMERNRHGEEMDRLGEEMARLQRALDERTKAATVLEQTVRRRIPDLEAKLEHANQVIATRDQELAERARAFENQTEAIETAQREIRRQDEEIGRLRTALESGGFKRARRWANGKDDKYAALEKENGRLQAELSRMREDLARLKDVDAADVSELRTEIHRLADLMLGGYAPSGATQLSRAEKAGSGKPKSGKAEQPQTAAEKSPPAGDARDGGKSGDRLSDRLAGLEGEKENANA